MTATRTRRLLVACYPRAWRERYGHEVLGYLDEEHGTERLPARSAIDLAGGAVVERARAVFDVRSTTERDATLGLRLVLWGWCCCAVGGLAFAKLSEHSAVGGQPGTGWFCPSGPLDRACAPSTAGADAAYLVVEVAAALAVIVLAALVAPALVVALSRAGSIERGRLRRIVASAVALSACAAGWLTVVVLWARTLDTAQRNGTDGRYSLAFVVLAVLVAATLVAWTRLAAAATHAVTPRSARALRLCGRAVAACLVVVAAGVGAWWLATAVEAPGVLGPFPAQSFAVLVGPSNGTSGAIEWPLVAVAESLLVLGAALGIVGATKLSARRTSRAS